MRGNKGITLIALIITIIVLLIIAGVTIATLTGNHGILTQTDEAKVTTIEARVDEEVRLAVATLRLRIANEASKDNSYDAREHTKTLGDALKADLDESKAKDATYNVNPTPGTDTAENTSASLKVTFTGTDYTNAKKGSATAAIEYTITLDAQSVTMSEADPK